MNTQRRELIDTLYCVQAVKVGLVPDAPRWLVEITIGVFGTLDSIAEALLPALGAFLPFALAFNKALRMHRSTLPAQHGALVHTNRLRQRRCGRE